MNDPIPDAQLSHLITKLSKTKAGFTRADGKHIDVHESLISKRCGIMVRARQLFRAFVNGRPVRYFATQESADEWKSTTKPVFKKPKKKKQHTARYTANQVAKATLLALIKERSSGKRGFVIADSTGHAGTTYRTCERMVTAGELFRANPTKARTFYFSTKEAADAVPVQPKYVKVKVPTPPKLIQKKAYTPAPKKPAQIIYPDGYKHSYHPMPPPRNRVVSVLFIHDGMRAMS